MAKHDHSMIALDEISVNSLISWIFVQCQSGPVRNVKASHEGEHLHLKLSLNYDFMPGWINIPLIGRTNILRQMIGSEPEADLFLEIDGRRLKGKLLFHGLLMGGLQNIPGIDSLIFALAPWLRNIGAFRVHGMSDFDYDLSSVELPDGEGGKMKLTDLLKFHSLCVGSKREEMLKADFSIIK